MGLRERNAHRTRENVLAAALAMFEADGYADTTMERIAEAADIHPATLYRYFPSKDLIVFADFAATSQQFAEVLEAMPETVPLREALMRAIVAFIGREDSGHMDRRLLRTIIDQAPAARARVWDLQELQRQRVAAFIAARTGMRANDPEAILSARIVVMIVETAADIRRDLDSPAITAETARALVRSLAEGAIVLPDPDA